MAGHTYVTKGYYNYDDFPAQEGSYAYGPEQHVNWYVVEKRTVERRRVPASGYTSYAPSDVHEGYGQPFWSDYENSSSPRYHDGENQMANLLNKLQIGPRPPMKTSSNISSPNKYRPTSPNKDRPTSPNKYYPTSPIKHGPKSPEKYESTSPNKYRPTSPNKYRPKSPNKPTSSDKYRSSSPDKYHPASPSKYRPTISTPNYPSKDGHMIKAQALPGPNKYRSTSPTKYGPTSPKHEYPSNGDHMNRAQSMPDPNKHRASSPVYSFPSKEGQSIRAQSLSGPNKYRASSPVYTFPSKEGHPIRAQSLSGSNKNHSSRLGTEDGRVDFPSANYHWLSKGPPTTRHPLMTPTNNIDEALGFLIESVNYSPRSHPMREGSFDNLSPRAQPTEHETRYARTASGGVTNRPYVRSNTIDSHEAVRRYNGAYVP